MKELAQSYEVKDTMSKTTVSEKTEWEFSWTNTLSEQEDPFFYFQNVFESLPQYKAKSTKA